MIALCGYIGLIQCITTYVVMMIMITTDMLFIVYQQFEGQCRV